MVADGVDRRVGFVGLGVMGGGMAGRLASEGIDIVVHDLDRRVVEMVVAQGATSAGRLADAGRNRDVVICMLPHPDVLREVVLGEGGLRDSMPDGAVLIDMGTDGPAVVRELEEPLAANGIRVVDAPVGRGPSEAASGELLLMAGGSQADVAEVEWLLQMLGSDVVYCGPLGSGQVVKLINNFVSVTNVGVVAEALALGIAGGVRPELLAQVLKGTAADSWQLRNCLVDRYPSKSFEGGFRTRLSMKDLNLALLMADDLGLEATKVCCGRSALQWYQAAEQAGLGHLDQSAVLLMADDATRAKLAGQFASD